jgi:hypothetical protein
MPETQGKQATQIMTCPEAFRAPLPLLFLTLLLAVFSLAGAPAPGHAAEPAQAPQPAKETGAQTLAVFPFSYREAVPRPAAALDEAHRKRLAAMTEQLRKALAKSDRYSLVSVSETPKTEEPASPRLVGVPAAECVSCALDSAKAAGAELAMIAEVEKVTAIVFAVTVSTYDVASGNEIAEHRVDVRGDDDATWRKGVEWLIRNRLLK